MTGFSVTDSPTPEERAALRERIAHGRNLSQKHPTVMGLEPDEVAGLLDALEEAEDVAEAWRQAYGLLVEKIDTERDRVRQLEAALRAHHAPEDGPCFTCALANTQPVAATDWVEQAMEQVRPELEQLAKAQRDVWICRCPEFCPLHTQLNAATGEPSA